MRGAKVWARMLGVEHTVIEDVVFDEDADAVIATVRPRRSDKRRRCGRCGRVAPWYDRGGGWRRWRALDLGSVQVYLESVAPRVACPVHGPTVAAVPWARHGARHTYAFDAQVAWLTRACSKSAVAELMRIDWATVGSIVARVMADQDLVVGDRLANVRRIGIDEVSYKKGHKYLVVIVDHASGNLLWVGAGRDKKTLAGFFDLLGPDRCQKVALVSADGADWIADVVALRCPNARMCMDPFHVVVWATKALDMVRAAQWRAARNAGVKAEAKTLKGCRFALWKKPADLTARQQATLAHIVATNNTLYRAYLLKEQLRQVFAPGGEERVELLDQWLAWASRSRIGPFVELARKMRRFRDDIANSLIHRLTNAPVEAMNTKIRLLTRMAFGFKQPDALMALIRLHLGGYHITLPGRSAEAA